jgi:hypothetical protein
MSKNLGFKYELHTEKGENILIQSVSGARIGMMLEHIAKTIYDQRNVHGPLVLNMVEARLEDGKVLNDPKKMESLSTLVTLAAEHYKQKAGKLMVETQLIKKAGIAENLKKVLSNPKKTTKLLEQLKLKKRYATCPECNRDNINLGKPTSWKLKDKKMVCNSCAKNVNELELPDLEVGDILKVGKFKNRAVEIKGFSTDEHGQPVADTTKGDQKIFKPRVAKLEPGAEPKTEAEVMDKRGKKTAQVK